MRKILEFEKFFKKGGGSGHGNSIGAVFFFPPKVINVRIWSSLLRLQVEKNQQLIINLREFGHFDNVIIVKVRSYENKNILKFCGSKMEFLGILGQKVNNYLSLVIF